jgi:hypothetical protein
MLELLRGHTSQETAVLVEDYPYGRLRCQIKYWVERATKGAQKGKERFVSMTSNPKKGNAWCNKPNAGTYTDRQFMYKDTRNGHIKNWALFINGPDYFIEFIASGLYDQLNEEELADLAKLIEADRRYNGRSWREYENNLFRVSVAMGVHGLDNPELYKLGGFDDAIPELQDRDGKKGGMFESDFTRIVNQIKAQEHKEYTIPKID